MFFSKYIKRQKIKPLSRGFYAFNEQRAGDFLIFVDELEGYLRFIYIPGGSDFYMSNEDFLESIVTGKITLVEQLPEEIFNESINLSLSITKKLEYGSRDEKQ